jgi:hypothetical protein
MRRTAVRAASLRYARPYWMLFLEDCDNWKIYTVLDKPEHQRIEMSYQAWLGGLDRPYVRPRCMATQPLWLEKKRHALRAPELQGPETSLERYVLQWEEKFHSFRGTLRPTAEDMHIAFELVERPLDLSYALRVLDWCRNENDIHFAKESFTLFLEACLRVDRKDVAKEALANAAKLGFWHVDPDVVKYLNDEQSWYLRKADGTYLPLAENTDKNVAATPDDDEEARLAAELAALEAADRPRGATSGSNSAAPDLDDEEARLLAEIAALEAAESKTKKK